MFRPAIHRPFEEQVGERGEFPGLILEDRTFAPTAVQKVGQRVQSAARGSRRTKIRPKCQRAQAAADLMEVRHDNSKASQRPLLQTLLEVVWVKMCFPLGVAVSAIFTTFRCRWIWLRMQSNPWGSPVAASEWSSCQRG